MKYILLNLKRFDILKKYGGINTDENIFNWSKNIILYIDNELKKYNDVEFSIFFPEAHIILAKTFLDKDSKINIGCQSNFREDVDINGNFGAFTSNRTAKSALTLGATTTLIGHCEERKDKIQIMELSGGKNFSAVNKILNCEIKMAVDAGLKVVYCIGENLEQQKEWKNTLKEQLEIGLKDIKKENILIAYEPVWAIGPGKTPPNNEYIEMVVEYIKSITNNLPVVYGGGLKSENAKELSKITNLNGGLIALTRFKGDIGFYPDEYLEIIKQYIGY